MLSGMTTPVRCTECEGRGWKIVTRRGHVTASGLGLAASAQEDCLHCAGPTETPQERFEWEVRIPSEQGDALGPCGSSLFQATAMDELRKAMRNMPVGTPVRGSIVHKVFDFGASSDGWSSRQIFRAYLDPAGSVLFERTAP
ncbi:hypothetical protein [Nonomuraea aridisoli]|uniref:hypothetical protein n=1 Tax=Nonomuraea aridisoli TaxID=2070368 RepID=UPI001F3FD348|nr:hypothetical protein [Nonomuraea aridisoli]